jgi:hypothetical protein
VVSLVRNRDRIRVVQMMDSWLPAHRGMRAKANLCWSRSCALAAASTRWWCRCGEVRQPRAAPRQAQQALIRSPAYRTHLAVTICAPQLVALFCRNRDIERCMCMGSPVSCGAGFSSAWVLATSSTDLSSQAHRGQDKTNASRVHRSKQG